MSNTVFPTLAGLTWNVLKSPRWSTKVQQSVGGKEMRAQFWTTPLYTWTLTYELLRASALLELQSLLGFFNARQGRFDSFLYSDPTDNNVTLHGFGVGDGVDTTFQLQRSLAGPRTLDWQGVQPFYSTPRRNELLWCSDVSNAAWGKTTLTVATGKPDPAGGLNACTLTATGTNSGAVQALGAGPSSSRINSVWLRRRTGSGVVNILDPLSSAFTPITLTSVWQRFFSIGGNGTTRSHGVQIVTSGDAVDFYGAQMEDNVNGAPTALIFTTSAGVTLVPSYWPAAGDAFEPVIDLNGAPTILVNGLVRDPATDYSISNGLVTFTPAPVSGAVLTWTGSYFWRVRFDLDQAEFNNFLTQLWEAKKITLVSVKAA